MKKKNHFVPSKNEGIIEDLFEMAFPAIPIAVLFFSVAYTFLATGNTLGLH